MLRKFLRAKIHQAIITQADLNYVGSITIDEYLMEQANILENEVVWIYNITNGERFETYVIKGKKNSGIIGINGAAARKVHVGDQIIIACYGYEQNVKAIEKPTVLIMNSDNSIKEII